LIVLPEPPPPLPVPAPAPPNPPPPAPPPAPAACEGQRPATFSTAFSFRFCQRPGCSEAFAVAFDYSAQRFCCSLCRLALRRVLDREARYRQRRRHGLRRPRPARPPPPS